MKKESNILTAAMVSCEKCWHSLVAPGCDSQNKDEEEDGAHDGPDDDVGDGDTWGGRRREPVKHTHSACLVNHTREFKNRTAGHGWRGTREGGRWRGVVVKHGDNLRRNRLRRAAVWVREREEPGNKQTQWQGTQIWPPSTKKECKNMDKKKKKTCVVESIKMQQVSEQTRIW